MAGRDTAFPSELSDGQQQRVAIARALAMQPELLLLDEITSALDPPRVAGLLEIIRKLRHAQKRTTMVLVTHHIEFAKDVGDSICFLDRGRIEVQGSPHAVLGDPTNERLCVFLESVRAIQ
jgi:ABC-type polar amino acid transport system ATPase subunit